MMIRLPLYGALDTTPVPADSVDAMRRGRRIPRAMRIAPTLDPRRVTPPPTPHLALLINPFYAKDPHASLGKHVLTPSLALTSIAAATPSHWTVRYWDENLLQGVPPDDPFPCVVGLSVHLTFAERGVRARAMVSGPRCDSDHGRAPRSELSRRGRTARRRDRHWRGCSALAPHPRRYRRRPLEGSLRSFR